MRLSQEVFHRLIRELDSASQPLWAKDVRNWRIKGANYTDVLPCQGYKRTREGWLLRHKPLVLTAKGNVQLTELRHECDLSTVVGGLSTARLNEIIYFLVGPVCAPCNRVHVSSNRDSGTTFIDVSCRPPSDTSSLKVMGAYSDLWNDG